MVNGDTAKVQRSVPRPPRRTSPDSQLLSREACSAAGDGILGWVDGGENEGGFFLLVLEDVRLRALGGVAVYDSVSSGSCWNRGSKSVLRWAPPRRGGRHLPPRATVLHFTYWL